METGEALALHASLSPPKGDVELLPRGRPEHPRSPATMEEEPAVQLPGQPEPAATEEDRPEEAPPLHPRVSGSDVVGGSSAEEIPAPDDDSHAPKAEAQGVLADLGRLEAENRALREEMMKSEVDMEDMHKRVEHTLTLQHSFEALRLQMKETKGRLQEELEKKHLEVIRKDEEIMQQ